MNQIPPAVLVARLRHRLKTLRYLMDPDSEERTLVLELEGLAEQIMERI